MFTEMVRPDQSIFRSAENAAFIPARYLFRGKTVKFLNNTIVWDALSFEKKNVWMTVAAIIALIPATILGAVFKGINLLSGEYRADRARVNAFKSAPLPQPSNRTFSGLLESLDLKWKIFDDLDSSTKWQEEKFIADVSDLMETGYLFMLRYFEDLSKDCSSDPKKMAERMVIQPQNSHEAKALGYVVKPFQDYAYTFHCLISIMR